MNELSELAKLDGLIGAKKKDVSMENAMSSNEKIRDWTEHIIGAEGLADKLDTKLKMQGFPDYYGLSDKEASERLKINGPN